LNASQAWSSTLGGGKLLPEKKKQKNAEREEFDGERKRIKRRNSKGCAGIWGGKKQKRLFGKQGNDPDKLTKSRIQTGEETVRKKG